MDRYTFYSKRSNYLSHSDEYGKKHYQKIDNYYGPGKARYFWSKEEWDAYQREKEEMYQDAKADVAKRDNYNKNAEAAKQAGADRAVKEKVNKYIENADYDNAIKTIMETPEVQNYIKYLKDGLKDTYDYDTRNEKYFQLAKDFTKWPDYKKYGLPSWLNGYVDSNMHTEALKESNANIEVQKYQDKRYKMEQDAMYQTALRNKDSVAVLNVVNKKIDDYWSSNYITVADTEIIDDYLSDLRETEIKLPQVEYIPTKAKEMTPEEDMKWVNYQRKNGDEWEDGDGNCMLCSFCMDLRQRGLDVSAPNSNELDINGDAYKSPGSGMSTKYNIENQSLFNQGEINERLSNNDNGFFELYTDAEKADAYCPNRHGDTSAKTVNEYMSKYPNTSGIVTLSWAAGGAHAIYYKVDENGKLTLYESQTNKVESYDDIEKHISVSIFVRTDNLTPDYKKLKEKGYIVYD